MNGKFNGRKSFHQFIRKFVEPIMKYSKIIYWKQRPATQIIPGNQWAQFYIYRSISLSFSLSLTHTLNRGSIICVSKHTTWTLRKYDECVVCSFSALANQSRQSHFKPVIYIFSKLTIRKIEMHTTSSCVFRYHFIVAIDILIVCMHECEHEHWSTPNYMHTFACGHIKSNHPNIFK